MFSLPCGSGQKPGKIPWPAHNRFSTYESYHKHLTKTTSERIFALFVHKVAFFVHEKRRFTLRSSYGIIKKSFEKRGYFMIIQLINTIYQFLWGDLIRIPLPGGSSLGISLLILLLIPTGIFFTIRTHFLPIRLFRIC